jgi:hypothetical protein
VGGSKRGWPVRSQAAYALQRLEWTGKVPFEIGDMHSSANGFELDFTQPVDPDTAALPASYAMSSYTYIYHEGYGSPEVDRTAPVIEEARVSTDGQRVHLKVRGLRTYHVHELHLPGVRSRQGEPLLHPVAYYTLNEIAP